jgi:hypothetical protein
MEIQSSKRHSDGTFHKEWDRVIARAEDKDDKELLAKVRVMANRCEAERHTFLRFVGD